MYKKNVKTQENHLRMKNLYFFWKSWIVGRFILMMYFKKLV